jgi:multidrug efflux pump subunit AcrB
LIVDDPIVSVDNITRHIALNRASRFQSVLNAMNEVVGSLVLTTLAIIVSFLPMFFITGMMGPYMQPMALNVPLAVTASTLVALCITPWVSNKIVRTQAIENESGKQASAIPFYRIYRKVMQPIITSRRVGYGVLGLVALLFAGSVGLALSGFVPLKMLPYDNKNEFQILIDMPETATLERTDTVARDLENFLRTIPEVTDYSTFVGTGSPMDFNGLVRHYYLREGPAAGDIRVNLLSKDQRAQSSHTLALRIRNGLDAIAEKHGANLKLIEVPPGPPVLATLVAEVSGDLCCSYDGLVQAAEQVKEAMTREEGVVDVDISAESPQQEWFFRTDRNKAALNGISTEEIARTLQVAMSGREAGTLHIPTEQNELSILLRLPRDQRSDVALLKKSPSRVATAKKCSWANSVHSRSAPPTAPFITKTMNAWCMSWAKWPAAAPLTPS